MQSAPKPIPLATPTKPNTATQTVQIMVVGACAMACLLSLLPELGHDQLWLLLAAQRTQGHLDPYGPLVFESNPPLAIWLSAAVVQIAGWTHLKQTIAFKLIVLLLVGSSSTLSMRLLPASRGAQRWLLVLAFVLIAGVIPARDFGQRDYILVFLTLPYVVTASRSRLKHGPQPVLNAVLTFTAAIGVALKPYQALVPICVELLLLFAAKQRRPRLLEPLLFCCAGISYLVAIRELAPRYFSDVLPLVRETYWAFGGLSLAALLQASIELQVLLLISFTLFTMQPKCRSAATLALLAAGAGATLGYLIQGTGWYYQQLPALSFFALALALEINELAAINLPRWTPLAASGLGILMLWLTAYFSNFEVLPQGHFPANLAQAQPSPDPAFYRALVENSMVTDPTGLGKDAVATLTTSVDDTVMPVQRYQLTLAQRYPHLWMLPAILRNESGPPPRHQIAQSRLADLDALQHRFMVEDLERWRPAMILVERCQDPAVHCQVLEDRHDDLLAFFLRDPAFAQIFARYRPWRSSGAYDAYVLR